MSEIRHAIVGIDPGSTIGVSILDLSGRKQYIGSFRNEGIGEAARRIEERCTPSIIACDVHPVPDAVSRLASFFSCKSFAPQREVREEEKRVLAHGIGAANSHERDAFCAAVMAYRAHANRMRQIDALTELAQDERDRIKHLLLRGYKVQDAFMILREPEEKEKTPEKPAAAAKKATPEELRLRLEELARENANLKLALDRVEEEKAALLHRLRLLENGVRQSVMRDSEFRKLRFQLQQTLSRLSRKGGKRKRQPDLPPQKQTQNKGAESAGNARKEGINNLGSQEVDLERLVGEYRKNRKII